LTVAGSFDNAGWVTVGGGSTLATTSGDYTQTDGLTRVNGALDPAGVVNLDGGFLYGVGSVLGNVEVSGWGTLPPGNNPGILTVNGNVHFDENTTLHIDLDGTTAGTGFAQLVVLGTMDITDAQLDIARHYGALTGQSYLVVDNDAGDPIVGTFDGLPQG